jgi:HD-GYP domain-containing protein (c-di-GMP phosphodiesterase class II)
MGLKEVKTSIEGLKPGMYVTRLNRPWIETPYPLQGLFIKTEKDIELLGRYCSFVYVDTERGSAPLAQYWVTDSETKLKLEGEEPPPIRVFGRNKDNDYEKLRRQFYNISSSFEDEYESAKDIKKGVDSVLKKVLEDLSTGRSLNIDLLKDGVEAVVSSIIRNPSAFALLVQMERQDNYTYTHQLATSVWCAQFGRHLGLERSDINELALGGMLLDIGKMKLPQELLRKKDVITPEEGELIRKHLDYSVRILAKTKAISPVVLRMVATHHERADGSGYPLGIKNDDIPIFGRIAGIIDTYDAMTSKKPYSDVVRSPHEAINELYNSKESIFQSELIEQFIQTVGLYPTGTLVEFESGEVAVVVEVNDLKRLFPTVMLVLDSEKRPLSEFVKVDLSENKGNHTKIKKALPYAAYGIKMGELFL